MSEDRSIKIAVMALGGQGGGVLSGWIVKLGESSGYIAQSTSVPGVAQRTGATIYYIELFPQSLAKAVGKQPVMALTPFPGDVDIVIAAELMEAGRAMMRGLVTQNTTLIASSHRDYAITEKIALGDGRQGAGNINRAAEKSAGRFIYSNMADAAASAGAVISAVLFGALAGSGALPIARNNFEETIRAGRRSVETNLRGFERGFEIGASATASKCKPATIVEADTQPSPAVMPLLRRLQKNFPPATHFILKEGLKRAVDFQDVKYAHLYLERLEKILAADRANGGEARDWILTETAGKYLALWMTYEDSIRVADLKTRASRFERFREDVHAEEGQIVNVSEYLHPRVEEICDLLPSRVASGILNSPGLRNFLKPILGQGKRIPTTKLHGFLLLRLVASLRFMRRSSYRFKLEEQRINDWTAAIISAASTDCGFACEIARMQRLIKGYGETHARGIENYKRIMALLRDIEAQADPVRSIATLRDAALSDEYGAALSAAITRLQNDSATAA